MFAKHITRLAESRDPESGLLGSDRLRSIPEMALVCASMNRIGHCFKSRHLEHPTANTGDL